MHSFFQARLARARRQRDGASLRRVFRLSNDPPSAVLDCASAFGCSTLLAETYETCLLRECALNAAALDRLATILHVLRHQWAGLIHGN
jgi:hypothetical protein